MHVYKRGPPCIPDKPDPETTRNRQKKKKKKNLQSSDSNQSSVLSPQTGLEIRSSFGPESCLRDQRRRRMGHGKSVIIATYIIFFIMLLEGLSVYVISTDLQNPPSSRGSTSTINFSTRRFYHSHGFTSSTQGDHVSQEQKRITPNGANPLHNR